MLEIDLVRVAIEGHPAWEIVDEISDRYLEMVDLVTGPRIHEALTQERVVRGRQRLTRYDSLIRRQLRSREDWPGFTGVEEAYNNVLQQVEEILGQHPPVSIRQY